MPSKNSLAAYKEPEEQQPVLPTRKPAQAETITTKPKAQKKVESKPKVNRVNKGFQVEEGRAQQWDVLVAQLKSQGKTGPLLIDEAMDYIFKKYDAKS